MTCVHVHGARSRAARGAVHCFTCFALMSSVGFVGAFVGAAGVGADAGAFVGAAGVGADAGAFVEDEDEDAWFSVIQLYLIEEYAEFL